MKNDNGICCEKAVVKSNNKYFGAWMCSVCNQLFDKAFDGEFLATGMYANREEQEQTKEVAKGLSILLGHPDLFKEDKDKN